MNTKQIAGLGALAVATFAATRDADAGNTNGAQSPGSAPNRETEPTDSGSGTDSDGSGSGGGGGVIQSTPSDDTPSPTGEVDGPARQVREPSMSTEEVAEEYGPNVDYDPNIYATPDSYDLKARDTVEGVTTPDEGDSQVFGAVPEDVDDDINRVGEMSDRTAMLFDRTANLDLEDL